MIGRRLLLRRALLGFKPGTPCRVQCVVDFGDGLHLWITTADEEQVDVDQIDAEDLQRYFIVLRDPHDGDPARVTQTQPRDPLSATATGETGSALGDALQQVWRRLRVASNGVLDSWLAARDAQRMLFALDMARGADAREQVIDRIRERVCARP